MIDWNVYFSGARDRADRAELMTEIEKAGLPVTLLDETGASPGEVAGDTDAAAVPDRLRAMRRRALIEHADMVVVRLEGRDPSIAAAFDAGLAVALGKPLVLLKDPAMPAAPADLRCFALAEVNDQTEVVALLSYAATGQRRRQVPEPA